MAHRIPSSGPLAPSVEKAYLRKCIELKRRINEVEESNDVLRLRKARLRRAITKMRVERAFLLEQIARKMNYSLDASDDDDLEQPIAQAVGEQMPPRSGKRNDANQPSSVDLQKVQSPGVHDMSHQHRFVAQHPQATPDPTQQAQYFPQHQQSQSVMNGIHRHQMPHTQYTPAEIQTPQGYVAQRHPSQHIQPMPAPHHGQPYGPQVAFTAQQQLQQQLQAQGHPSLSRQHVGAGYIGQGSTPRAYGLESPDEVRMDEMGPRGYVRGLDGAADQEKEERDLEARPPAPGTGGGGGFTAVNR